MFLERVRTQRVWSDGRTRRGLRKTRGDADGDTRKANSSGETHAG